MASANQAAEGYSAVLFMDGAQVSRQMRASEFGAFLDGYVGLSDLADTDVRAVHVVLGGDLLIRSLVFFRIYFDEEGRADSHWNLPVEQLAQDGAKGPDLGGGAIRLVCRSQCPAPNLADELWDPDMTPGSNHFQAIRKAIDANSLKFQRQAAQETEPEIPVLRSALTKGGGAADDPETGAQRSRLAQTIREQRLRIKTLQSVHRDALSDLQREHRLEMQALRSEMADLEQKYERQRLTNEQLKKRLADRNEQYLSIQERMGQEADSRNQENQTNHAEVVLLREQLERKQRELEMRNDKIILLEQENHDLRHREPVEDSLMRQLQVQSVFLVAYHAGVGHLTLPYSEIDRYFENPTAYAAAKCGLNEPAYREWLAHYEAPTCHHKLKNGKLCGEPILRVSQPGDFQPGRDDRCEAHQVAEHQTV
ncbi:MAG: DNA repair protein [Marinobacter sp.]|uniref:DNA repair protein n=1 Tax=Marinobacter sp. TaxID=50741 RepID=UPI00299E7347|nr:DNA repair protein [Marinobacter sp.]MDX1633803.1 DNA repair protein [Marinobacter sp.]